MTNQQVIEKIILAWDLQIDGKPLSYDFETLKRIVDSVDSGNAVHWIHLLENQGYISINVYGKWSLMPKGERLIPPERRIGHPHAPDRKIESTEVNWAEFRRLLSYYIECVKAEDVRQYRLKPENEGRSYFVPKSLDAGWMQSLISLRDRRAIAIEIPPVAASIGGLLRNEKDGRIPCIGYPIVASFDLSGDVVGYTPIAMVPIKFDRALPSSTLPGAPSRYSVTLEFEKATFNYDWVKDNVDNMDLKNLLNELDEDADGAFDMANGLPRILGYTSYNKWLETDYNPSILTQVLPVKAAGRRRRMLCNTAVVFKMQDSPYNRSLIMELNAILEASPAALDQTALAYIYRKPPLPIETGIKAVAIPYLPSNGEQLDAVRRAFEYHLSVLQGPPGTGKSQTAVNIIANCIYREKSVVFSSRNHAAIDAIRDKSYTAVDKKGFPIVRYCKEEGRTIDWFTANLGEEIRQLYKRLDPAGSASSKQMETAIDTVSRIEQILGDADARREAYLEEEAEFVLKNQTIGNLLVESGKAWWKTSELKEIGVRCSTVNLYTAAGVRGFLNRLFNKKKYKEAVAWLANTAKVISDLSIDKEEDVRKFAKDFIPVLKAYLNAESNSNAAYRKYEAGLGNRNFSELYDAACNRIDEVKYRAFFWRWASRADEWSQGRLDFAAEGMAKAARNDNGPGAIEQISTTCTMLHELVPAWAVSLQSASHVAPLAPAVFDLAIIDEASQCDVASIIPILYRAKDAVMVGDPEQFRPIVTMSPKRHENIWARHFQKSYAWRDFDYYSHSAFDIASGLGAKGMLKEHFRSADGIAAFYNSIFYGGQLRVRTRELKLNFPEVLEDKSCLQWIDVKGGREFEIEEAVACFEKIHGSGYDGSIGIISPLRKTVDAISNRIRGKGYDDNDVKVDTSYAFQGGECDVIIFVLGYDANLTKAQLFYLCDNSNRNIYNVTVSRAKACLIIIGDKERCTDSSSDVLRSLASYPRRDEQHAVRFDSPLEEKLYTALLNRGIKTVTQYYCRGYLLDMAYEDENVRLDIEVDGSTHFGLDHIRKPRDYRRDNAVRKDGWKPLRFVSFEVIEDVDSCVDRVVAEIERGRSIR